MPRARWSLRSLLVGSWWAALVLAGAAFLLRDVPSYVDYTAESYGEFWERRWALVPHAAGALVAFAVGFLQFSRTLRARRPRLHRALGYVYVAFTLIAAPAAIVLGLRSSCPLCRPPLTALGVLWLATTIVALVAARARELSVHRAFMIRSFGLMNVFTLIRLLEDIPVPGLTPAEQRVVWEWTAMAAIVIGIEIALTWTPTLRRLRAVSRVAAPGPPPGEVRV